MSLGGRPSRVRHRPNRGPTPNEVHQQRVADEERLAPYAGHHLSPLQRYGLSQVARGGMPMRRAVAQDLGNRYPALGLVALWAVAIWRIWASIVQSPRLDAALVWSVVVVALAVGGTISWVRAGRRKRSRVRLRFRSRPCPPNGQLRDQTRGAIRLSGRSGRERRRSRRPG